MNFSLTRPALFVSLLVLVGAGLGAGLFSAGIVATSALQARQAASAYTVRIVMPATDDAVTKAALVLAATPDVRAAAPMNAARAASLLSRWGGRPFNAADLPALHLIEVRTVGVTDTAAMAGALKTRLSTAGITADVYDSGPARPQGAVSARNARAAGGAIALAALLALAFATAAAARAERARATLWADHGATRHATLAAFGRAGAEVAFLAGAAALILALALTPGMRAAAGEAISFRSMIASLSPWDVLIGLGAPLAAAAAGMIGARIGAAAAYDAADRLG